MASDLDKQHAKELFERLADSLGDWIAETMPTYHDSRFEAVLNGYEYEIVWRWSAGNRGINAVVLREPRALELLDPHLTKIALAVGIAIGGIIAPLEFHTPATGAGGGE